MTVSTVDIPIPPSVLAVSTVDSNIPLEEMTTATGSGSIPNVLPITTPSQQSIPPKTSIINTRATIIQQHQKPLTVPINRHKAQDKDIPSSLISPKDPNPTTMTPNNSKNNVIAVSTVDITLPCEVMAVSTVDIPIPNRVIAVPTVDITIPSEPTGC